MKSSQFFASMNTILHTVCIAHLLTGSLIATRKSCACSAMGEKASRIICPSSGLIQRGRDAWSGLRCNHEKSCS